MTENGAKQAAVLGDATVVAPAGDVAPVLDATLETTPSYRTGQTLLARFEKTGDEAAFEQLVRMYAGMVYTVCNGVTKNAHDAEDSCQATFLSLATQVKLGKPVKYLGPWLRQVAKRTALDLRKSRKRRQKREENHHIVTGADTFDEHLGEANLTAEEHKKALHDEINKLPARYRLPLVMHYFGGLKPEETAVELNCKPKTLAVRLHRGRKMLAEKLSRRGMFVGSEMLGVSCVPAFFATHELMSASAVHQTSHAASSLLTGHDISTLISSRVMALLSSSAKVAFFAKIKFAAAALVLVTTMMAGGARAIEKIGVTLPFNLHLPSLRFNMTDWIRPMLRSLTPTPKVIADASSNTDSNVQVATANREPRYVVLSTPAGYQSNNIAYASFDTSVSNVAMIHSANDRNFIASGARVFSDPVGPVDLTEPDNELANDSNGSLTLLNSRSSSNGIALTDELVTLGPTTRRVQTNVAPTPEPSSVLLLGSGALIFSRVVRKRRAK